MEEEITCASTLVEYMVECAKATDCMTLCPSICAQTGQPCLPGHRNMKRVTDDDKAKLGLPIDELLYYGMGTDRRNAVDKYARKAVECRLSKMELGPGELEEYATGKRMWRATTIYTNRRDNVSDATICDATSHARNTDFAKGLDPYSAIRNPDVRERSLAGRLAFDKILGRLEVGEHCVLFTKILKKMDDLGLTPAQPATGTAGVTAHSMTEDGQYMIFPMPKDGSCLFHSLGHHLGVNAAELRSQAADHIEAHPEAYELELIATPNLVADLRAGDWGDGAAYRAIAHLYQRNVVVYRNGVRARDEHQVILENTVGPPLLVHHSNGNHYDAMMPVSKPVSCAATGDRTDAETEAKDPPSSAPTIPDSGTEKNFEDLSSEAEPETNEKPVAVPVATLPEIREDDDSSSDSEDDGGDSDLVAPVALQRAAAPAANGFMHIPDDLQDSQLLNKWLGNSRGTFEHSTLNAAKKLLPIIWPYLAGNASLRPGNNKTFSGDTGLGTTPAFNTLLDRVRAVARPVFEERQARAAQKAENRKRREAARVAKKRLTASGFEVF